MTRRSTTSSALFLTVCASLPAAVFAVGSLVILFKVAEHMYATPRSVYRCLNTMPCRPDIEIDAYLSRLCQAPELMSGRMTEPSQKKPPKRKLLVDQVDQTISSTRRTEKGKFRSNRPVVHRKGQKQRRDRTVQVAILVSHQSSQTEQLAIVEPERTMLMPKGVAVTRLPARRRVNSFSPTSRRTAKWVEGAKHDAIKSAIALTGPANAKIVVVSAELRQEREHVASLRVRHKRAPASGPSGRAAFEALVKDDTDTSKGSAR